MADFRGKLGGCKIIGFHLLNPIVSKVFFPFLLGIALLLGFWYNTLRAREMANDNARLTCARQGFQFLDGTVALLNWQLAKGKLALRRTYQFEYSDNGDNRQKGIVIITANKVESIILAPDNQS